MITKYTIEPVEIGASFWLFERFTRRFHFSPLFAAHWCLRLFTMPPHLPFFSLHVPSVSSALISALSPACVHAAAAKPQRVVCVGHQPGRLESKSIKGVEIKMCIHSLSVSVERS